MSRNLMVTLNRKAEAIEALLPSLTPREALEAMDQLQHLTNRALERQATTAETASLRHALAVAKQRTLGR